MNLDKQYYIDKVKKSIDDKERSANITNMLLYELLEYTKLINEGKNKVEEVKDIEPVVHVNKGRKASKG